MYLRRKLNREGGFTLAEILVAGLIMAVALIPIVRMFDTSFMGIRKMEALSNSINCAEVAMEEIRTMPFYEPHTQGDQSMNYDIDDRFWGTRSPVIKNYNEGESLPVWESTPQVVYYTYGAFSGYEDFRVTVQLCYLTDSTGVASMQGNALAGTDDDWGPKKPGKDRPANSQAAPLHLLLVRVNAYWMEGESEDSYSLESIVTDNESVYNLGLTSITVTGPAQVMGTKTNAATHWSNPNANVNVTVKGYGFDAATIQAYLVRDARNDIPITLGSKNPTTLTGTMNLYSGHSEATNLFNPKADIGYWTVKIKQQGILSTYLYQGFVVEYPKPVITDFGNDDASWPNNKTGSNDLTDVRIKITGGPFVYKVANPTVSLVQDVEENPETVEGTIVSVTGANTGYTSAPGCTIIAQFDLTELALGPYNVEVTNVEPELIGHVTSDPDPLERVYTVTEPPPPEIDTVYVFGSGQTSAYRNVGNPWKLVFEGRYFSRNGTPPVEVWLCESVTGGGEPAGNRVQGTNVSVPNNTTIIADFNLSGLPVGFYKGYVKNLSSNLAGWTVGAPFEVREFNANIGSFVPNTGYAFFENYYDIPSKITGAGFLSTSGVFIRDTTASVDYDLAGEYTVTSDNEMAVNLNLINCNNAHNWRLRVYFGSEYVEKDFDITLGPAKILPPDDTKKVVRIYAERSGSTSAWHEETTAVKAWAWNTYRTWFIFFWVYTRGYATFEVKGMGFPIPTNGQTNLRVWGTGLDVNGNFDCTMDRNTKTVKITSSPRWEMPLNSTGLYNMEVYRSGDAANKNTHLQRWELKAN